MSIVQLSKQVYYLPAAVNTAIIKTANNNAILVDTGQDKNYGRNIRKALQALDLKPVAIINTHSHADHYGGNDYLLRQFDITVYAPEFESALMQEPYLEPVYLFGGAKPLDEMMSKWLLAKKTKVDYILKPGYLEIDGLELEIIDTGGHAHKQIAVVVGKVLIAADAVFGSKILKKYPLPFGQDISRQIESAKKLKELCISTILPGHGTATNDVKGLIDLNLEAFDKAAAIVLANSSGTSEHVLEHSCRELQIELTDVPRYYLNLCTIKAYLSYLRQQDKVEIRLMNNRLEWYKI